MVKFFSIPMKQSPARSASVFERFAEFGSARRVWLWLRSESLSFPLQNAAGRPGPDPLGCSHLHRDPSHPHQSGVCWRLHLRQEPSTNATSMNTAPSKNASGICPWISGLFSSGASSRLHRLGHLQANQTRLDSNTRPRPHRTGGAVREGSALLQGIVVCGHCGRGCMCTIAAATRLRVITAPARISSKDEACTASTSAESAIEQAVANAFLEAITPGRHRSDAACGRATPNQSRCGAVSVAVWKWNVLRYEAGTGRAPLPGSRTRKPSGRARSGNRMGEPSARCGDR